MKPKYLNIKNNIAYIRDFNLFKIANNFQTPLYLFDQKELEENMEMFKKSFNDDEINCNIVYASKAFLVPEMCKLLSKHGLWMDAVSYGDLYIAKRSKFQMKNIIFHGNNKSIEELEYAMNNDVIIVIDHLKELDNLCKLSHILNKKVRTMVRINPGIDVHTHNYIQTATITSKFGESIGDEKTIDQIMKLYLENRNVTLMGFHSHIGSQIQEIQPFLKNVEKMMYFSKKIETDYKYKLTSINFGGGFGVSYFAEEKTLNKENTLQIMIDKIKEIGDEIDFHPSNLFIEPGRSILGNSCVSLYTCGNVKITYGGKKYVFIDGGMTDNIRPALYQAKYEAEIVNKMEINKNMIYDIAGKCCESGDIICSDVSLPQAEVGDIIMIYNTGAYTYSMSSNYNNMLKPAVVFLGDSPKIVSRRESLLDLVKLFPDMEK